MTTPQDLPPPVPVWRKLALHPLLVVLWLGSFLLAAALEHAPHASLWFPPAAVTFAGLFCAGWRAVPALVLACALGTWLTEAGGGGGLRLDVLLTSSLVFALIHTGAYALPAMMLRRLAREGAAELTLRAVSQFLLLGALGALLAASLGVLGLRQTGLIETPDMFELAAAWWIGDYAALVTLAPALALLMRTTVDPRVVPRFAPFQWGPWHLRPSALRKLALLLSVTAVILVTYLEFSNSRALLVVLVLPVVLQLWIVHTEDLASSQLGVLAFSLLTVGAAATVDVGEDALVLQFAAVSLAANTYLSLAAPALLAANARLRDQVSHDGLTGALSRVWFEDRAGAGLGESLAGGRPASLLMLDLNRLKQINDTHGHAAGDAALQALVACCKQALRAEDFIGRLSGDEFAIFLPRTDAAGAARVVEAIRARLDAATTATPGVLVSASFGIATATQAPATMSALLHAADEAMYADKRASRAS